MPGCGRSSSRRCRRARCRSRRRKSRSAIRDGRLRVGATTLEADGARAIISGGYDIPADQADIRASLASTAAGQATSHPEIQLFAAGSPDALDRTVDVAVAVVVAGGAGDRSRNPPAGFDRARRAAARGDAGIDSAASRRRRRLRKRPSDPPLPMCRCPAAIRAGFSPSRKPACRVRRPLRRAAGVPPAPMRRWSASRLRRCRRRSRCARRPAPPCRRSRSRRWC